MIAFLVAAGGLLLGLGAILMMMSIVPTSLDASWDEVKEAFHIMSGKPQFRIGAVFVVIGFLMTVGPMYLLMR